MVARRVFDLEQTVLESGEELISSEKGEGEIVSRLARRQKVVLLYEGLKPFERQVSVFLEIVYDSGFKTEGLSEAERIEHIAQVRDDLQVLLELGVMGNMPKFNQATVVLDNVSNAQQLKKKKENGHKLSEDEQKAMQPPSDEELELASCLRQVQRRLRDFLSMSYLAKGLLEGHKPPLGSDNPTTPRLQQMVASAAADTGLAVFKTVLRSAADSYPQNGSLATLANEPTKALEVFVELARLRIMQHQNSHPYDSIDQEQPEDLALAVRILEHSRDEFPAFKMLIDAGLPFLQTYVRLQELKAIKTSEEEKQHEAAALTAIAKLF